MGLKIARKVETSGRETRFSPFKILQNSKPVVARPKKHCLQLRLKSTLEDREVYNQNSKTRSTSVILKIVGRSDGSLKGGNLQLLKNLKQGRKLLGHFINIVINIQQKWLII